MKKKNFLLLLAFLFCGCDTLTAWQSDPRVQFAETETIKLMAAFFSNGGQVDAAWGVANGLNLISDVTSFTRSQADSDAKLKAAVKDFAGNQTAITGLANGVVSVVNKAAPQTPEQTAKLVQVVAANIQKAAAQATP